MHASVSSWQWLLSARPEFSLSVSRAACMDGLGGWVLGAWIGCLRGRLVDWLLELDVWVVD